MTVRPIFGVPAEGGTGPTHARFTALLGVLNHEKEILERLLYRLTACVRLVEADEHRFLALAGDEVMDAEEELGAVEAARAMLVADIAELVGLPDDTASLTELVEHAAPDLAELLIERRRELRNLLDEIGRVASGGARHASERLAAVGGAMDRFQAWSRHDGYSHGSGMAPPATVQHSA